MFKFFRRRGGNLRDDNASDIITENAQINASDSAPILNNRYDPKNGNTYSCTIKLTSPNSLEVRGYIGVSLIGRTDNWTRQQAK